MAFNYAQTHRGGGDFLLEDIGGFTANHHGRNPNHVQLSGPSEWLINSLSAQSHPKIPQAEFHEYQHAGPSREELLERVIDLLSQRRGSESDSTSSRDTGTESSGASDTLAPRQLRLRPGDKCGEEHKPVGSQVHQEMPGQPCEHQSCWKRLRHKKGWTYFICTECNIKWKRTT